MEAVLSLPINAIALDNEEMEYVDGGYSISKISNGYLIRLSSRECGDLSALIAGGTSVTTAIATVIPVAGPAIAAGLAAGFGLWGTYFWICSNHNGMYILANKSHVPFGFIIAW